MLHQRGTIASRGAELAASRAMPSQRRIPREAVLVAALLALHAVLAWLGRRPGVLTAEDPARYLLLAGQLRHLSYRSIYLVSAPLHTFYPPGYPLLLALWGAVGGGFDWAVVFSIVSSIVGLGFVYVAIRERWGMTLALLVLGALAVNPMLLREAGSVGSEAPYLAVSMGALWGVGRPTIRARTWAILPAAYAGLVRAAGAVMLPALGITWLLQRRWRPLLLLVLAGVLTVGAWQVYTLKAAPSYIGMSYAADFAGTGQAESVPQRPSLPVRLAQRVSHNAVSYATTTVPLSLPLPTIPGTLVDNIAGLLLYVIGGLVGLVVVGRKWLVSVVYVGCYLALILVWPWSVGRYLEPLIPLMVLLVIVGWREIARKVTPERAGWIVAALAAVLISTGAVQTAGRLRDASSCIRGSSPPDASCVAPEQASFFASLRFIRDSVAKDAVLLSGKPAIVDYYTGVRGVEPPLAAIPDSAGFVPFLEHYGISDILLTSVHGADISKLAPDLEAHCSELRIEAAFPPYTYLFRMGPASASDDQACRAVRLFRFANRHQQFDFGW